MCVDSRRGALRATEHLLKLGHRRIAIIDNAPALGNFEKQQGYVQALNEAGIEFDRELSIDARRTGPGQGYAAAGRLLSLPDPPTAILAANDLLAIGAIHRCDELGIKVPEDISVIGFDNIELAAHARPPLTTVSYDAEDLSQRAVAHLLRLMAAGSDNPAAPQVEFVDPDLIVRDSTGPIRRQ